MAPPPITTVTVTDITTNSATSGGGNFWPGGATVIAKGICWNIIGGPTLGNCLGFTDEGAGEVDFVSYLTGLIPATHYYVRAYRTKDDLTTGYDTGAKQFDTDTPPAPSPAPKFVNILGLTLMFGGKRITNTPTP